MMHLHVLYEISDELRMGRKRASILKYLNGAIFFYQSLNAFDWMLQ